MSVHALCEENASVLTIDLPFCEADAWAGEQEDALLPGGYISMYYQKVSNPNADDYRPRQVMPIETYESKAGMQLMRAYDLNAGFVKSFRLDAVQRILLRNQNLDDDAWGVQDITFRGRSALSESL
jgi:hypothetical protein